MTTTAILDCQANCTRPATHTVHTSCNVHPRHGATRVCGEHHDVLAGRLAVGGGVFRSDCGGAVTVTVRAL